MGYNDETWYGGNSGLKYYPCILLLAMHILSASYMHICSDWLITKNANTESSVWDAVMKLGMWVVVDSSITHVFCCFQCPILSTSFAYLF